MSGENSHQSSVIQSFILHSVKLRGGGGVPDSPDVRTLQSLNKNYPIVAIYHCLSLFAIILSIGKLGR